ncbi:MAG TPA: hypothetical protein VKX49_24070 [Bryobacteraceae bacterium]|nr:hypothetical protein [Bryobacteraceae bacterium]
MLHFTAVLVASTTVLAGPHGRKSNATGWVRVEKFMAPVEPGSLPLRENVNGTPILPAPGCFYSDKPNLLDPMLGDIEYPACKSPGCAT